MTQASLVSSEKPYFGGALLKGRRKSQRPLSRKLPIHLVLKASKPILFKNKKIITNSIEKYAVKFGIKVYSRSIQKDHVHLNLRIHNRPQYIKFIRMLSSILARKLGKGLWKARPFSRIGRWGRDFRIVQAYIEQNEKEILGLAPYKPRNHRYQLNTS